ncbi:MAG TPA: RecX family transcriptional regulator [Candidatus Sulfotelmatobacter sp.]|nr:RecX family transcriptional regulator [Candidatus Sulfotelmatobacter sp.]
MDNFDKFYNKTLRFLSFRPRSQKEIEDYLKKKNCDIINSQKIIEKLKEHNFLNDEEFVKWWIEQRTLFRPRAERVIKMELKQKGINKDLIDKFFEKSVNQDKDLALKLAQKRMLRYKNEDPKKKWEKMVRYLSSKGFIYDDIKEVIDQILPKGYNN